MRTTTFYSKLSLAEEGKKFSQFVSKAAQEDALKDLRSLLPDKKEVDEDKSLLFVAGNAVAINLVNLNSVGMQTETALRMHKTWARKPINIAHDRTRCIGYITDAGFSSFGDNKVISQEDIENSNLPFNVTISGIIWRLAGYGYESEMIEECDDPKEDFFHNLSISWEVGYTDYSIALSSRNLSKAKIITDEEEVKKYTRYLRGEESEDGYVGDGFTPEGDEVYCVITGNPVVLGIGLTFSPASAVQGVVTGPKPEKENKSEKSSPQNEENQEKTEKSSKKDKNLENNVSQPIKNTVKRTMKKFNNLEEINLFLTEANVDLPSQRAFEDFLTENATALAKEYKAKIDSAASDLANSKKEAEETKTKLTAAETELAALKDKIAELESKVEEDRKQTVLASRMEDLSDKFDLSEASVRKAIVKQIKDLDDTAFASWLKEDEIGGILLAGLPKKEARASVDPDEATKALKETKASVTVPNAQDETKGIDKDKISNALIN